MTKRIKAVIVAVAVVAASVAATLALLEAGMRIADGVSLWRYPNFIAEALDIIRANTGVMDFDETLGWKLKDNLSQTYGMTTGAYGLRMNDSEKRDPPTHAILAVGDSFTAGSGVADRDTWPAQLERLIGKPVLNAGVGAYGVDQMVLDAERLAPLVKPSALIVGILTEDVLRDAYDVYGGGYKPWFSVENGEAVLHGTPVPRVSAQPLPMNRWRRILGHSYLVHTMMMRLGYQQSWLANEIRYHRAQSDTDAAASACALMGRMIKLGATYSAPVFVVIFHGAAQAMLPEPVWYAARVRDCAKAQGLGVLDLYGPLKEIGQTDPVRFKTLWIDEGGVLGHPSAAGDAITAQLLKDDFFH